MAVHDVATLLKVLEKSTLLSNDDLEKVKQEVSASPERFDKPEKVARHWIQSGLLTKWQVIQLLSGKVAFFLGKYKLLNLIGVGGMGRVFLAEHTIMQRKVALKVISGEFCKNPDAIKQFQAEARAIAALNHVNIVQAYNFECEEGRFYIVMEYVDGESLEKKVQKEGPLSFDDVISFTRQSAKALKHAHERNMVHCDIKPENLLLNKAGQIKILDMGIAKLHDPQKAPKTSDQNAPDNKKDASILGSVDYMAPEMATGDVPATPCVDIYSLGCTMFFLLTGKVPYPEDTLVERILAHQEKPPRDPRELRPDTPSDLANIILKMEAKNPDDRYQSMDEVLADLDTCFPESTNLNISEGSNTNMFAGISGAGSSSSNKNRVAWSNSVATSSADQSSSETRISNDSTSKSTKSFDFLSSSDVFANFEPSDHTAQSVAAHWKLPPGTTLPSLLVTPPAPKSSSQSSAHSSSHISKNIRNEEKNTTGRTGADKKNTSKKKAGTKSKSSANSGQMEKKVVFGGIIGLAVLLIIVIILLLMPDDSDSTSKSSTDEATQQKRAAEILEQQRKEAGVKAEDTQVTAEEANALPEDLSNFSFDDPAPDSAPAPAKEETPKE